MRYLLKEYNHIRTSEAVQFCLNINFLKFYIQIMRRPTVSFIVTVFNKGRCIENTAHSLLNQVGDFDAEFIFVDDNSTDNSVAVLEKINDSRIRIIRNSKNRGPSIRLNQGAREARGDYLQFIDGDDVLVRGATQAMISILQKENADLIYGKYQNRTEHANELLDINVATHQHYQVSDTPLQYVLTHRNIVRMVLITTRACFEAAGGCDESIFIQDESLPLCLALKADRFIDYAATVVLSPASGDNHLSNNADQTYHDGFMAFKNLIARTPDLNKVEQTLIKKRAMSVAWKYYRRIKGGSLFSKIFICYILSKTKLSIPSDHYLPQLEQIFSEPSIRTVTDSKSPQIRDQSRSMVKNQRTA